MLGMKPGVTRLAEGLQVRGVIPAAVRKPALVVDGVGGCQLAVLFAQLTQRVRRYVSGADFAPLCPVAFSGIGIALVFVVALVFGLLVLFAKATLG